jgi:hypothetical protein
MDFGLELEGHLEELRVVPQVENSHEVPTIRSSPQPQAEY